MLRVLKENQPTSFIVILVLGLLTWLQSFITGPVDLIPFDNFQAPLYQLVYRWTGNASLLRSMVGFLIYVLITVQILQLNSRYDLIQQRSYLPAFYFLIIASSLPFNQGLNPVAISLLFLILAIGRCFESYKDNNVSFKFFEATLLLSIGSMFYLNMVWFLLFIFVSIAVLRPYHWREWVIAIAGMIVPWAFYFAVLYLFNKDLTPAFSGIQEMLVKKHDLSAIDWTHLLLLAYLGLILLLSSWSMIKRFATLKVGVRNYLKLLLWLFILSLCLFLFNPGTGFELWPLVAVPISYIVSSYHLRVRSKFMETLLVWGIIVFVLVIQVVPWI